MRIINLEIPEQKKVIEEKVMVVLKFEDKSFVNGIIGLE
jgi:hypothetical protein